MSEATARVGDALAPTLSGRLYPLARAQQRLWMLYKLNPDSLFYHISLIYSLQGSLDVAQFEKSLQLVLKRHSILRVIFPEVAGKPMQVIRDIPAKILRVIDLRNQEATRRSSTEDEIIQEELKQPFDLTHDFLVRPILIQLDEDRYTLLLILHHIITDMWSMDIFCRELGDIYNASVHHETPQLPSLSMEYVEYAVWEQSEAHREQQATHQQYWREVLGREVSAAALPYDHPRPPVKTFNGNIERITLSKQTFRNFQSLCKDNKTTLFAGLFAAFNIFLHRITGQTDLLVGTFLANRHRSELENMIGLLFHDLPIRTRVNGNASFNSLVQETRRNVVTALAHSDCAIDELIEELHGQGIRGREPVYNVTFQLYHRNEHRLHLDGIDVRQRRVFQGTKFDLMFYGSASHDTLDIWFNYNSDLFEADTVRRLLHYFNTLIQNINAAPDRPIAEVELLTSEEKHKLLFGLNATAYPYPSDKSIPQLFEAQAQSMLDNVAVLDDPTVGAGQTLSYRALNEQANRLAWYLRKQGVGPGTPVGVLLDRTPAMVVADLAILKAGGACVLLDAHYPPSRIHNMLLNAGARYAVTSTIARSHLETEAIISIDINDERILAERTDDLPALNRPEDVAFIVYTSGSTGKPKGVMLTHRGVINQVFHRIQNLGITKSDVLCLSLSVAFSTLPLQLLSPFFVGCPMMLYAQETVADAQALFKAADRDGVSLLEVTVSSLRAYLRYIQLNETQKPSLTMLRIIMTAGEKLTPHLAHLFYQHYPELSLVTTFGQSECTGIIANAEVPKQPPPERIVEGRPSINNKIYVLDEYLQPTPPGVHGTVYFSGHSVAKGYINNPEETARVFQPNPFVPGEVMVNTGDRANRLPDGRIEVIGRRDVMVKIRGNRVELPEVEGAIRAYPGIIDCVASVRKAEDGQPLLVAYFTRSELIDHHHLRRFLQTTLPEYMIPSYFVELDRIPLNPNNKVDRMALPDPRLQLQELEAAHAPQSATELHLLAIWQAVLQVDRIGRNANFFELGGHSLRAMDMAARIQAAFGVNISLPEIFGHAILSDLAACIDDHMNQEQA